MFGGAMISLILPKLIRSVARDGIFGFLLGTATRRTEIVYSTTQGKPAAFKRPACQPATSYYSTDSKIIKLSRISRVEKGDGLKPPPKKDRIT